MPKIPSPYYRVSLKAIVLRKQKLLVVQTDDGTWELPGGGWEHDESMQHCVRREIMEELGVGVRHINFSTMYPYSGLTKVDNYGLKLAIPVTLESQDFKLEAMMQAFQFVTPSELAQLDMHDDEAGIKTHIPRIWPPTNTAS
jgi:8-oxo-dGTP pyrophosphatase MutT (NUDIX family)